MSGEIRNIGLLGARGKMGTEVAGLLATEFKDRARLLASVEKGEALNVFDQCDAIIDFSSPEAALGLIEHVSTLVEPLPALVLGSTGWNLDGRAAIRKIAERAPVLLSANFSTGVLLMTEMLKEFAPLFDKLGYTPVVVETHHKHKKDSPSGTAISLQRVISPAGPGNVQTHAVRAGEIVGDHAVTYYGAADTITITHHAQNRSIFARGAIEAALWLAARRTGQNPPRGLLGMEALFKEMRPQPTPKT